MRCRFNQPRKDVIVLNPASHVNLAKHASTTSTSGKCAMARDSTTSDFYVGISRKVLMLFLLVSSCQSVQRAQHVN